MSKFNVSDLIDSIVFEHPSNVMQAFLLAFLDWLPLDRSKRLNILSKLVSLLEAAQEREIELRSNGEGRYHRKIFPADREIPIYDYQGKVIELKNKVSARLRRKESDDGVLDYYAMLVSGWFYSCPEALLQLTPDYLEDIPDNPEDVDYANALHRHFYLYLLDPKWQD
jgi:hypothetical protein